MTMPPHSPVDASPMPITRGSNGPNVRVGPDGQAFGNPKPLVLGRNPGTAHAVIDPPAHAPQPAEKPASSSASSFASSRAFVEP